MMSTSFGNVMTPSVRWSNMNLSSWKDRRRQTVKPLIDKVRQISQPDINLVDMPSSDTSLGSDHQPKPKTYAQMIEERKQRGGLVAGFYENGGDASGDDHHQYGGGGGRDSYGSREMRSSKSDGALGLRSLQSDTDNNAGGSEAPGSAADENGSWDSQLQQRDENANNVKPRDIDLEVEKNKLNNNNDNISNMNSNDAKMMRSPSPPPSPSKSQSSDLPQTPTSTRKPAVLAKPADITIQETPIKPSIVDRAEKGKSELDAALQTLKMNAGGSEESFTLITPSSESNTPMLASLSSLNSNFNSSLIAGDKSIAGVMPTTGITTTVPTNNNNDNNNSSLFQRTSGRYSTDDMPSDQPPPFSL